ncbi:MAG: PAS domain S-box protein, partial [Ignavibacteria bacterium]
MLRIARIGGWSVDHVAGSMTWSREFFELFELDPEETRPSYQAFLDAVHPDDREAVNRAFMDALANAQPYEHVHRVVTRSGPVKWLHEKCETEFDESGVPIRSVGIVQDVTDRHETLLALQASEARLRSIFDNANTGIASTDAAGRVTSFNEAFRAMLGFEREVLAGMNFTDFTHPEDLLREIPLVADILERKREHYHMEKRYIAADGRYVWVDISVAVVRDPDGGVAAFVAVVKDITERQRVEAELRESISMLTGILQTTRDGYWCVDESGRLLDVNPAYCAQSGYRREELLGMFVSDLEARETPAETAAHIAALMRRGSDVFESRHRRKDGSIWDVEISTTHYRSAAGERFFVFVRDITERKRANAELRIAAATFEANEGMMVTDAEGVVLRVNRAFTDITGYGADEIVGRTPRVLKSGRHDEDFFVDMWRTLRRTGTWQGEIWDRRKNGEIYPKWLTITAIADADGTVTHYVGTHSDITDRKRAEEQVRQLAFQDPLTQLPNRRLFQDRLRQAIAACRRSGAHGALMFIDLDNFKPLNDAHGHAVGDLLLVEAAARLKSCVRESDTVSRFGGDEFVVM